MKRGSSAIGIHGHLQFFEFGDAVRIESAGHADLDATETVLVQCLARHLHQPGGDSRISSTKFQINLKLQYLSASGGFDAQNSR